MMQGLPLEDPFLKLQYGCPAANLVQKMTPLNVEFGKGYLNSL
jgi:TetR/AcrR family transcriptional regulator, transcriptional repressor for nem operon